MNLPAALTSAWNTVQGTVNGLGSSLNLSWVAQLRDNFDFSAFSGIAKSLKMGERLALGKELVLRNPYAAGGGTLALSGLLVSAYLRRELESSRDLETQANVGRPHVAGLRSFLAELPGAIFQEAPAFAIRDGVTIEKVRTLLATFSENNLSPRSVLEEELSGPTRKVIQPVLEALDGLDRVLDRKTRIHNQTLTAAKGKLQTSLKALYEKLASAPDQNIADQLRAFLVREGLSTKPDVSPFASVRSGADLRKKIQRISTRLTLEMGNPRLIPPPEAKVVERVEGAFTAAAQARENYVQTAGQVKVEELAQTVHEYSALVKKTLEAYLGTESLVLTDQETQAAQAIIDALPQNLEDIHSRGIGEVALKLNRAVLEFRGLKGNTGLTQLDDSADVATLKAHQRYWKSVLDLCDVLKQEATNLVGHSIDACYRADQRELLESLKRTITKTLQDFKPNDWIEDNAKGQQLHKAIRNLLNQFPQVTKSTNDLVQNGNYSLGAVIEYRPKATADAPNGLHEDLASLLKGVASIEKELVLGPDPDRISRQQLQTDSKGEVTGYSAGADGLVLEKDPDVTNAAARLHQALTQASLTLNDQARDAKSRKETLEAAHLRWVWIPAAIGIIGGLIVTGLPHFRPFYSTLSGKIVRQLKALNEHYERGLQIMGTTEVL